MKKIGLSLLAIILANQAYAIPVFPSDESSKIYYLQERVYKEKERGNRNVMIAFSGITVAIVAITGWALSDNNPNQFVIAKF